MDDKKYSSNGLLVWLAYMCGERGRERERERESE